MAMPPSNLIGQVFGYLKAIEATEKRSHNGTVIWRCECLACGAETEVASTKLKAKEVISCGCKKHECSIHTIAGHSGLTKAIAGYKAGAKRRGLDFELTRSQFQELTQQDCFYCGTAPSNVSYGSSGAAKEHGKYVYNGIDRLNNDEGYTLTNCVPCCKTCNIAKHTRDADDFLEWIRQVYEHTTQH